jgi:hypothetical protein
MTFNRSTIWSWVVLIAAALIAFRVTGGTQYHALALGVLLASITLLILLFLFEVAWQLLEMLFDSADPRAPSDQAEKS